MKIPSYLKKYFKISTQARRLASLAWGGYLRPELPMGSPGQPRADPLARFGPRRQPSLTWVAANEKKKLKIVDDDWGGHI